MKWKEYPQNLKVRLITSFFNRAISSAVMPFMALFFAQHKGAVWAGIFLGMIVLVTFIGNFIGGYISDRFRRKKILLITSIVSAILLGLMTASLIPEQKWIDLFAAAYLLFMISGSLGRPSMQAIIVDSTTAENRKAIYAVDYWLTNLSMAIGAAIGGLFYGYHQLGLFIALTFAFAALPVAYALWLQDTKVPQLKKQHTNVIKDLFANYQVALRDKPFVMAVLGGMCIYAAEFSLNSYIGVRLAAEFRPLFIGGFELSGVRMLSLLNIENMMLVVLFTFIVTKITDRFDKKKTLLAGLIVYSIGYTVITSANVWYLLLLFNLVATIGELMYSPIANAEKANMMPDDKRGSYSAFSGISFSGADLIARSTIILGAFLVPSMMSVYIGLILLAGTFMLYGGLFVFQKKSWKEVFFLRKTV